MKKKLLWIVPLLTASCLTINIYFPAEEVKDAADKIVKEVWGTAESEGKQSSAAGLWQRAAAGWGIQSAHAEQNINVSTPQIRQIKGALQRRALQLKPHLDTGAVGIGQSGLLKVRDSAAALNLKQRAALSRLIAAENDDRMRLYQEIAAANRFPDKAGEVQAIFARSWREQARSGWFLEIDGQWQQKP